MKVFVTGAEGFIGSHLVEALVRDGQKVKALYLYNFANDKGWLADLPPDVLKDVELVSGDIRDSSFMKKAMKDCSTVFHLAALIGIPYSYEAPESYIQTNVVGSLNVFQSALELGMEKVIHTSTSEVYGSAQYVPIDELHRVLGQSPYSASKIGADHLAHSYWSSFGLPVTTVRPFNTFGPRQSTRAIIPNTIIQLLESADGQISLGDTRTSRDFTYVSDTVAGFIAASKYSSAIGQVINLGTGYEITIQDLVMLIADILELEPSIKHEQARFRPEDSEVQRLVSNPSKAASLLAWEPKYNSHDGLRTALAETIRWYSKPKFLGKFTGDYVR